MSAFKANRLLTRDGTVMGTPINIVTYTIPPSSASVVANGYIANLSGFTTSNTTNLYSFYYTPVSKSSHIVYVAALDVDGNSSAAYNEHLLVFINNVPYSTSYYYRRNSGNEPMSKSQSGVYNNTSGATLSFSIRGTNNNGGAMYLGTAYTGTQSMSNTITIFEVQK